MLGITSCGCCFFLFAIIPLSIVLSSETVDANVSTLTHPLVRHLHVSLSHDRDGVKSWQKSEFGLLRSKKVTCSEHGGSLKFSLSCVVKLGFESSKIFVRSLAFLALNLVLFFRMPTLAVKKQQMALLKTPEQLPWPRILEANLHMHREVEVAAQGSSEAVSSDVEVVEPDIQSTSTKKEAVNVRYAKVDIFPGFIRTGFNTLVFIRAPYSSKELLRVPRVP